jgi:hypothetical protein
MASIQRIVSPLTGEVVTSFDALAKDYIETVLPQARERLCDALRCLGPCVLRSMYARRFGKASSRCTTLAMSRKSWRARGISSPCL